MLASPETATDADYAAILGVIGHEVCYHFILAISNARKSLTFIKLNFYGTLIVTRAHFLSIMQYFHNWTGNRWFCIL